MRVEIIAKNYKASDRLKEIINMKLEKFDRYFEDDAIAKVVLKVVGKERDEKNKAKEVMEITVFFGNNVVRSEVMSDEMYKNIDLALPKIEGQIRKYRTKLSKMTKTTIETESIYGEAPLAEKELVKTKSFELHKISVKEAMEEMELVDHDFYAFINKENGMVNVVYRRGDGNIGLLDFVY